MYCRKCGAKLGDNDRFCASCGTQVPEEGGRDDLLDYVDEDADWAEDEAWRYEASFDDRSIYPGMEADEFEVQWMDKAVVQSDNIITGQGPAKAAEFAIALIGYLEGRGMESKIRDEVILEYA